MYAKGDNPLFIFYFAWSTLLSSALLHVLLYFLRPHDIGKESKKKADEIFDEILYKANVESEIRLMTGDPP